MASDQLSPRGSQREPSLAELLGDPIMQLLWRRDGLRGEDVADEIAAVRRRICRERRAA